MASYIEDEVTARVAVELILRLDEHGEVLSRSLAKRVSLSHIVVLAVLDDLSGEISTSKYIHGEVGINFASAGLRRRVRQALEKTSGQS